MSFSPVRLNHAVLFVSDLDRAERFYRDIFGMEVIAREPRANAAFLRLPSSGNHHDLGLFGIGAGSEPKNAAPVDHLDLAGELGLGGLPSADTARSIELLATEVLPVIRRETGAHHSKEVA